MIRHLIMIIDYKRFSKYIKSVSIYLHKKVTTVNLNQKNSIFDTLFLKINISSLFEGITKGFF